MSIPPTGAPERLLLRSFPGSVTRVSAEPGWIDPAATPPRDEGAAAEPASGGAGPVPDPDETFPVWEVFEVEAVGSVATGNQVGGNLNQYNRKVLGDQTTNNYYGVTLERRRIQAHWRNHESLAKEARTTASPVNVEELVAALGDRRFLVLVSERKSGQRTAARYLIHRLIDSGRADSKLHAVRVLLEGDDLSLSDVVEAHENAALIIDLTEDDEIAAQARGEFDVIAGMLAESNGYLVLILTPDAAEKLHWLAADRLIPLRAPDGRSVFASQVGAAIPPPTLDTLLADPWLVDQLEGARPPTAAWLARSAVELSAPDVAPSRILDGLRNVRNNWVNVLETEVGNATEADRRALILAAALLPGAEAGAITAAADELQRVTKTAPGVVPPLCEKSPHIRLKELEADFQFDVNRRRYVRPGYGDAILPYMWSTFRVLRRQILEWWMQLLTHRDRMLFDTNSLVTSLVRVAWRSDVSIPDIASLLIPSSNRNNDSLARRCEYAAVALLSNAATHEALGRPVRRMMWEWARGSVDARHLVVAKVCSGEFSQRYPQNALTRLKYLLRSDNAQVRTAAASALRELAAQIGFPEFVATVASWRTKGHAEGGVRDVLMELMTTEESVDQLVAAPHGYRAWSRLLDMLELEVKSVVKAALAYAAELPDEDQRRLIYHLRRSIGNRQRRYDLLLYAVNRRWSDPQSSVEKLHSRVLTALDEMGPPKLAALTRKETV